MTPHKTCLLLAPLLAAACAPTPNTGGSGILPGHVMISDKRIAERGDFETVMLAQHNAERARFGVGPLVYDAGLARDAASYAKTLADQQRFAHSPQSLRPGQGENLWMGTRDFFTFRHMVGFWIEEKRHFRSGRIPNVSSTGNFADVGHYTAIVWPDTTHVGCGIASNANDDYLVCRYSPPGNIIGETL